MMEEEEEKVTIACEAPASYETLDEVRYDLAACVNVDPDDTLEAVAATSRRIASVLQSALPLILDEGPNLSEGVRYLLGAWLARLKVVETQPGSPEWAVGPMLGAFGALLCETDGDASQAVTMFALTEFAGMPEHVFPFAQTLVRFLRTSAARQRALRDVLAPILTTTTLAHDAALAPSNYLYYVMSMRQADALAAADDKEIASRLDLAFSAVDIPDTLLDRLEQGGTAAAEARTYLRSTTTPPDLLEQLLLTARSIIGPEFTLGSSS